jgi:hypothetical protein
MAIPSHKKDVLLMSKYPGIVFPFKSLSLATPIAMSMLFAEIKLRGGKCELRRFRESVMKAKGPADELSVLKNWVTIKE